MRNVLMERGFLIILSPEEIVIGTAALAEAVETAVFAHYRKKAMDLFEYYFSSVCNYFDGLWKLLIFVVVNMRYENRVEIRQRELRTF